MKPNNNNQLTPSEIPPQSGQTISDSNHIKKYEVFLILNQLSHGSVIVEASSPQEAREKAEVISEVFNWEIFQDEISIESVEPVSEGKSRD